MFRHRGAPPTQPQLVDDMMRREGGGWWIIGAVCVDISPVGAFEADALLASDNAPRLIHSIVVADFHRVHLIVRNRNSGIGDDGVQQAI